jgi:hypothetical protein
MLNIFQQWGLTGKRWFDLCFYPKATFLLFLLCLATAMAIPPAADMNPPIVKPV